MIVKTEYLFTRNARDKLQIAKVVLEQKTSSFFIHRTTGQLDGKHTAQPVLEIEKGKAKRSVLEQANLQYNSIISKYKDKGYKSLSDLTNDKFENLSYEEIENLIPGLKTDGNGNLKHMLAKDATKCAISIYNQVFLCSKKLNGVRCSFKYVPETDTVKSISRGGKDYDCATTHIREILKPYLKENPSIILDGELYKHGMHLQTLSGIARLKTWNKRCEELEFWIYDIMDGDSSFSDRLLKIIDFENNFYSTSTTEQKSKIKFLEHVVAQGWNDIKILHDRWVSEGYEGLVGRKPDKKYEFGKRTSSMIKVKDYQDDEFLIVDYKDGLRPEDFCFICQTKDGKLFSAKPTGDRELKEWYMDNINSIIGEYGKVTFFDYSLEGIPSQTVFKCVRYSEDID